MLTTSPSLNIPLEKKVVSSQESETVKLEVKNRCSDLSRKVDETCTDVQGLTTLSQKIDFNDKSENLPFEPFKVADASSRVSPEMSEHKRAYQKGVDYINAKGGNVKDFTIEVSNAGSLPSAVQAIVQVKRELKGKIVRITPKSGDARARAFANELISGGSYRDKVLILAGSKQWQDAALNQESFHAYIDQWAPFLRGGKFDVDYFKNPDKPGHEIFKDLDPEYPYRGHEVEEFFSEIVTLVSDPDFGFKRITNVNMTNASVEYRLIADFAKSIKGKNYTKEYVTKKLVAFAQSCL